jgi:glucose-1-phosphate thymidylyltransferase
MVAETQAEDRDSSPKPEMLRGQAVRPLKGLVLSGGKGSRLRPLTATGAKQLVPVANKPVLFYALEQLVEAGIRDIAIIIGDTGDQVRAAVGDGSQFGATVTFIEQDAPLGLAHAVSTAREFLGDAAFCMYLGDNFLRQGIATHAASFARSQAAGQILLKEVPDVSALGVAVLDDNGKVSRLVEKPSTRISPYAVVGVYFFGPEIHQITPTLTPSARGELEITDAIQGLVDAGLEVDAALIQDVWIDTGKKDDMLEANRVVLSTITTRIEGQVDDESSIVGDVIVEDGARIIGSAIRGPAVIGRNARLERAYVGPFTAIGEGVQLIECEIEHSIVLENSTIRHIATRITDSLIGKEVIISRSQMRPQALRLMVGDHGQLDLS